MAIVIPTTADPGEITYLDLQNEVLAHGFNASRYRARVKRWVNEGLARMLRTARVGASSAPLTLTPGDSEVQLPAANFRLESVHDTDRRSVLVPMTVEDYDRSDLTASGPPTHFALVGTSLFLWPTPDRPYSLEARYRGGAEFTLDEDTFPGIGLPQLTDYWNLPVSWSLSRAYRSEDDPEMANFYHQEFQTDLMAMRGDLQRPMTGNRQIRGLAEVAADGPRFRLPGR